MATGARSLYCLCHLITVLILAPAVVLSCLSDEAPLQTTMDKSDFLYSVTNSTVKGKHARYGSGKSVKVFTDQVFEMVRFDGSWVFTFHTLTFEVKGADTVTVSLIQATGDVITDLQVVPGDTSIFELVTVGDLNSPVSGVSEIHISFESTGSYMTLQQMVIQACGGCPLGYDSLSSLYGRDDLDTVNSKSDDDPTQALRGSGSFLNVSVSDSVQLTMPLTASDDTFLLVYASVNVTAALNIKFAYKVKGELSAHHYKDASSPDEWTVLEMTVAMGGEANVTKVTISAIPANVMALISDVFVLACRESSLVVTTVAADLTTCYLAGENQNDFTLAFDNPSSTFTKPSNAASVLKGSGIQVWVYDYTLVITLPSGGEFDLVDLTVSLYFLQTGTYTAYDTDSNIIKTGTLTMVSGSLYRLAASIPGVGELRIHFQNSASFSTTFVYDMEIDACPQTETTTVSTEAPTTEPPTTEPPTTEPPTTEPPTTEPPTTEPPTTEPPTTEPPTTVESTTSYYTTTAPPDSCPDGSAILYAKHTDVDFDIYLDENDLGLNPMDPLEGSDGMLTVNENNTYHVNRSILGVPYRLMEVRFDIRGASEVLSGALDYIGYISQMIVIPDSSVWTSVNLTIQDGGFVDIFEVTLEWFGDADINVKNLFVLACKTA